MTNDQSGAVLSPGEKVHVVFRRAFEGDVRRHFFGEVRAVSDGHIRADGYAFVFDPYRNTYVRKPEKRTRVFSLSTEINLNVIAASADIASVLYDKKDGALVVTDGATFTLDVNELGPTE